MYDLEYGNLEGSIIRDCIRTRRPLPDRILNAPEIWIGNYAFYIAFQELTTCRTFGMSVGPIPFTAIVEYCRINRFDEEMTDDMIYIIRQLDNAYLAHIHKDTNKKKDKRINAGQSRKGISGRH